MQYLCDTCVLIDYLKGREDVHKKLTDAWNSGLGMSSVTYMELMVGAFNKQEAEKIRKAFHEIELIDITESISIKARSLIDQYTKSHGLLIPDALIAATAIEMGTPLYTANISDFRFIPELALV